MPKKNEAPGKRRFSVTRKQFLKKTGLAAGAVAAAGLGLSRTSRAGGPDTNPNYIEIVPTGNPETDPQNVQAAMDGAQEGATILLRASPTFFNFGETGKVMLKKDVTILGEPCGEGESLELPSGTVADRTAIYGGGSSGTIGDFTGVFTCATSIDFTVEGIWFDDSAFASIFATHCRSKIEIRGNKATNFRPIQVVPDYGKFFYGLFGALDMHPLEYYPIGNMHGEVILDGNVGESSADQEDDISMYAFLGLSDIPDLEFRLTATNNAYRGNGGTVLWCPGVSNIYAENNSSVPADWDPETRSCSGFTALGIATYPHIIGNSPRNVVLKNNLSVNAIMASFNATTCNIDGDGEVLLQGNEAVNTGASPAGAWGVWGGAFICGESRKVTLSGNRISCDGASPALMGIALNGYPSSKWDLGAPTSEASVSGNTLEGQFIFGIYSAYSDYCVMEGNDLSDADCIDSNILLGPGANSGAVRRNKLGRGVGVKLSFLQLYIDEALYIVQGREGHVISGNEVKDNSFAPGSQVGYLIHDSVWALVPTPAPTIQFKVDRVYPHFKDNSIIHSGAAGSIQLENVDEARLKRNGNTLTNVQLTEGSPVSNDSNQKVRGPAQGPKWEKIRAAYGWGRRNRKA